MRNYLLIKQADNKRFETVDLDDSGRRLFDVVGGMADKAGVKSHKPIRISTFSKELPEGLFENAGGLSTGGAPFSRYGGTILLNDRADETMARNPFIALHEYGHNIHHNEKDLGSRFLEFLNPVAAYDLRHGWYEDQADSNARRLLDTIEDPKKRQEAKKLYSRHTSPNKLYTRVMRPMDLSAGIGATIGAAGGTVGGGYLGYKAGDKLYRKFHKATQQADYKPTLMHNATRIGSAAFGGFLGNRLGGVVGHHIGAGIGQNFVDKDKLDRLDSIYTDSIFKSDRDMYTMDKLLNTGNAELANPLGVVLPSVQDYNGNLKLFS